MTIKPTDEGSEYIGDGVYAHKDKFGQLWVFTYNGINVTNSICLENEVMESLIRFYNNRIDFKNES